MQTLMDDFVAMNENGLVLELCQKYYAEDVLMLNNGSVFAESMREAYNKQKSFVGTVKKFEVKLLSSTIQGDIIELVFHYKMTTANSETNEFTGKHIQTWKNQKIVREEYLTIN